MIAGSILRELSLRLALRAPSVTAVAAPIFVVALAVSSAAGAKIEQVADHEEPAAGEHPRLMVRKSQVDALKKAGQDKWGKAILARLEQTVRLMAHASLTGRNRQVIKEAGYEASGHAAMYMLGEKRDGAMSAAKIAIDHVINYPMVKNLDAMDRLSRLQGVVFAYDMAYDGWSAAERERVRKWVLSESDELLERTGKGRQPERVIAQATAGLVDLALLGSDDDKARRKRLAECEKAIAAYLDQSVGDYGFDVHGESVRQAAFASGILPFVRANKLVMGRDLTGHPAVRQVMLPMVYMVVPGAGMPVLGPSTAALDRSGLFAMSFDLAPEEHRPAIMWLFDQVGGPKYKGIVRPHHAIYMLRSGMDKVEAAAPGDAWAGMIRSEQANLSLFRTGWQGREDILAVAQEGTIRIIGMGAHWAGHQAQHAAIWSHEPSAGALESRYLFLTRLKKSPRLYDLSVDTRFDGYAAEGDIGSVRFGLAGEVKRLKETMTVEERDERNKKVKKEVPVAPGGKFTGSRLFAVDYSGKCGAPGLFVFRDELSGGGEAPRVWVLHGGYNSPVSVNAEEGTFTITHGETAMRGTVVTAGQFTLKASGNPPYANFLTIYSPSDAVEVVMTLQEGEAPAVTVGEKGLAGGVRIGDRVATLKDGQIILSD